MGPVAVHLGPAEAPRPGVSRTGWARCWGFCQDILVCDLLGSVAEHRVEPLMHSPAGQSIAYFDRVTTVGQVMESLVDGAHRAFERLCPATPGSKRKGGQRP